MSCDVDLKIPTWASEERRKDNFLKSYCFKAEWHWDLGRLIPGPKVTDFRLNVGLEIGSLMEHLGQ